jgi:DNA replication protein DnaC
LNDPKPMLTHPTVDQLRVLRLEGMIDALEEQRRDPRLADLDFEERLALLVERQWLWKSNRALAARLQQAQLKLPATLEDIDYRHPRGLKRAQIDQLRVNDWIGQRRACLITGPTGCGKTYLACALGHQACRDGHRTLYYHAPKLFRDLQSAQADGTLAKRLKQWSRITLLIIDDLGLAAAGAKPYRELLEIIDDRLGKGSVVITSQFPVGQWHELVGDATVADALMDRLVHHAYRLELKGESMRKARAAHDREAGTPADPPSHA